MGRIERRKVTSEGLDGAAHIGACEVKRRGNGMFDGSEVAITRKSGVTVPLREAVA